jgi:RNA-binding protein
MAKSESASRPALPEIDPAALAPLVETMTRGAVIAAASPRLHGKARRHLRSLGNTLKPVVMIGHQGLTPALAQALDVALTQHELIKVKVLETCPSDMGTTALWLHRTLSAAVPQWLGHTLLVYRPFEKDPVIRLPANRPTPAV